MRATLIFVFLLATTAVISMAYGAAVERDERNQQYPWYYWNMDGQQQGQYPPYFFCGADGISSLNMLSLSVVGVVALAFTGIPATPSPQ